MYTELIRNEFLQANQLLNDFLNDDNNLLIIQNTAEVMAKALKQGNKILSCGNGGSHCDAMHFAEELTGRYRNDRPGYAAIAISDVSHITCVGNDFGYENIFSRYVESVGNSKDILLGISTSGQSESVIRAFEEARNKGLTTIALSGKDGGRMSSLADLEIRVPYFGYADRIQEIHIKIIHILIMLIEQFMSDDNFI